MRRFILLSATLLALAGCGGPPVVPPTAPAEVAPAPIAALPAPSVEGVDTKPASHPVGRDPFSHQQADSIAKAPVVISNTPRPTPPAPVPARSPIVTVDTAPAKVDYTVAGIFRSPRGDTALLNGKSGPLLVRTGSRLDSHAWVSAIDHRRAEVDVRWGARQYVLPLHQEAESGLPGPKRI